MNSELTHHIGKFVLPALIFTHTGLAQVSAVSPPIPSAVAQSEIYLPLLHRESNNYPRFDVPLTLRIDGDRYELDVNQHFNDDLNLVEVIYRLDSDSNKIKKILIPRTQHTRDAMRELRDNWSLMSEIRLGTNAFTPPSIDETHGGSLNINGMKGSGVDLSHLSGEVSDLTQELERANGDKPPPFAYDFTAAQYRGDGVEVYPSERLPRLPFVFGVNYSIETLLRSIEGELKVGDPRNIYVMEAREPLQQMEVGVGDDDKVALSALIWAITQSALNQLDGDGAKPIAVGPNVSTKWQIDHWKQYYEVLKNIIDSEYVYTGQEVIESPFFEQLKAPSPNFSYNLYANFADENIAQDALLLPERILNVYEETFGKTSEEVKLFILEAGPDNDEMSEDELEDVYFGLLNLYRDYTSKYTTVHMSLFLAGEVIRIQSVDGGCLEIRDRYVSERHPRASFISPTEGSQASCTDHDLAMRGRALVNALIRFNNQQSRQNRVSNRPIDNRNKVINTSQRSRQPVSRHTWGKHSSKQNFYPRRV